MSHLSYIFKLIIFSMIVMIVMQTHIGHKTIEDHAEKFIRQSYFTAPARDVAAAGIVAFKHFYHSAITTADTFVDKEFGSPNAPGRRKFIEIQRNMKFHQGKKKISDDQDEAKDSERSDSDDE